MSLHDNLIGYINREIGKIGYLYEEIEEARDKVSFDYGQPRDITRDPTGLSRRTGRGGETRDAETKDFTISQIIIYSSLIYLHRYLSNENSLKIIGGQREAPLLGKVPFTTENEDGELVPVEEDDPQLTELEDEFEKLLGTIYNKEIAMNDMTYGIAVVLTNEAINPYILNPEQVYINVPNDFVACKIRLTQEEVNILEQAMGLVEPGSEQLMYENNKLMDVTYGNCMYSEKLYRFIKIDRSEISIEATDTRDLNYTVFDMDPGSKNPMGVYAFARDLEYKNELAQVKKNKIVRNVLTFSVGVRSELLPESREELIQSGVFPIDVDIDTPLNDAVVNFPTKKEDLPLIFEYIKDLEDQVRKASGLYEIAPLATDETNPKTATEVLKEYERTSAKYKNMIDRYVQLKEMVAKAYFKRRKNIDIKLKKRTNPIDQEKQEFIAGTIFADLMTVFQADPDGTKLGGTVDGRAISKCLKIRAKSAGLDPSDFDLNFIPKSVQEETAYEEQQFSQELAKKEIAVKDKVADGQKLSGEADLIKAHTDKNRAQHVNVKEATGTEIDINEAQLKRQKERADLLVKLTEKRPNDTLETIEAIVDRMIPPPTTAPQPRQNG